MLSNTIDAQLAAEAQRLMDAAERIVIFTHMGPDGDAMGSSLAMYHYLSNEQPVAGKQRKVTVVVPNAFPDFLAWMPGSERVMVFEQQPDECGRLIAEADLCICLDFNDPKRIAQAADNLMQNPCPKLLIDHHLNPTDFTTVTISEPQASSTCELVSRLFYRICPSLLGKEQGETGLNIATCLYTGLMTDTGNFSYNSNNPDLYEIVAQLMRAGIQKDQIYDRVFNQFTEDRMRLTGYCLYRKMRLYPEHHLALITLSIEELKQFNYKQGDTEGIVNMPLQMGDIFYSVLMREQEPKPGTTKNVVKISFRSQGERPVNIMAAEVFRGGGHMNASGGEYYGTVQGAAGLFLREYPKYLKK